ncbi:hypothetical protein [Cohnella sp. REN36]|uniref:hypothetical protein n=1 Tax=Cohnella sp. REN36 TaxID=2887347 RepID=UPI00351D6403
MASRNVENKIACMRSIAFHVVNMVHPIFLLSCIYRPTTHYIEPFKEEDRKGIRRVKIKVRGYCRGTFDVKTSWDGPVLGKIPVDFTNVCTEYAADLVIPDGIQALYFTFTGMGNASLASFTLE